MEIEQLIKALKTLPKNAKVLVSSDEELNTLYTKWEISKLTDIDNTFVIFGHSGFELKENL
jgi:predicted glycosyltransferase